MQNEHHTRFAASEEKWAISIPIVSLKYKLPKAETKQHLECISRRVLKEQCK